MKIKYLKRPNLCPLSLFNFFKDFLLFFYSFAVSFRPHSKPLILRTRFPTSLVDLYTRAAVTRLRTTFFQVSRVRRGATQRDYRLLYYKFFRFPENREPRHFSLKISPRCARQRVYTIQHIVKSFLRAARGLE